MEEWRLPMTLCGLADQSPKQAEQCLAGSNGRRPPGEMAEKIVSSAASGTLPAAILCVTR